MLDRQKGKFVVECDTCGEVLETDTGDFHKAREVMKENNWKPEQNKKGDWEHFCPSCQ